MKSTGCAARSAARRAPFGLEICILLTLFAVSCRGKVRSREETRPPVGVTEEEERRDGEGPKDHGGAEDRGEPAGPGRLNDLRIPMRDGESLAADVRLPARAGPVPAILMMTPYSRKNLDAPKPDETFELDLPDQESYAFVVVDWRGYFGSRSARKLLSGGMPQHARDGYDVVEWIAVQPWSNGKVAMWGASGPGRVQFAVAGEQPPHLVAISPVVAADGFHYSLFYHGGVLRKGYVDMLGVVGFGAQGRARNSPPVRNEYWRRIEETTSHTEKIRVPVLLTAGWYDLSTDTIVDTFLALSRRGGPVTRKTIKMWIGPWHHVAIGKRRQGELEFPAAEGVGAAVSNRFFDYHLRGVDNGWSALPRVTYLRMGRDEWFTTDDFPPPGGEAEHLYLASGGQLTTRPPAETRESASFVYDPADPSPTVGGMNAFIWTDPNYKKVGAGPRDQRPVESRSDCVVFTSPVLGSDVVLEGNALARLFVSSDRVDTDVAVRLTDVHPDGRSMLITDGIQRMRFREGGVEPSLLKPGVVYPVEVELAMTAQTFRAGHRIRAIISSANYPRFDRNPNVDRPRLLGARSRVATNRVHFGREHPAELLLPRWAGVRPMDRGLLDELLR